MKITIIMIALIIIVWLIWKDEVTTEQYESKLTYSNSK